MNKIFFLAVAMLMVSCGESDVKEKIIKKTEYLVSKDSSGLIIAFYKLDSLQSNFEYFLKVQKEIENKISNSEGKLRKLENELASFLSKKEKQRADQLLSQNEIAQVQEKAQLMQQKIMRVSQEEELKLQNYNNDITQKLAQKLESYGKKFCEEHKIDVLFQYAIGQQINYINPKMDVTADFINFLNTEHKKRENDL